MCIIKNVAILLVILLLGAQSLYATSLENGIAEVDALLAKEDYIKTARLLLELEAEYPRNLEVQERMKRFTMIVQLRKELDRPVSVFVPDYAQKALREYEALRNYFEPTSKETLVAFMGAAALVLSAEVVAGWVEKQTAQAKESDSQERADHLTACIKEVREGSYKGAWIVECGSGKWRGFQENGRGHWESIGGLELLPATHSWPTLQQAAKVFCGCD